MDVGPEDVRNAFSKLKPVGGQEAPVVRVGTNRLGFQPGVVQVRVSAELLAVALTIVDSVKSAETKLLRKTGTCVEIGSQQQQNSNLCG